MQDVSPIIDQLAAELGVKLVTRKKWHDRGWVPHRWRLPIVQEASKRGVEIVPAAFDAFRRPSDSRARAA
jgi:hypothetical protein